MGFDCVHLPVLSWGRGILYSVVLLTCAAPLRDLGGSISLMFVIWVHWTTILRRALKSFMWQLVTLQVSDTYRSVPNAMLCRSESWFPVTDHEAFRRVHRACRMLDWQHDYSFYNVKYCTIVLRYDACKVFKSSDSLLVFLDVDWDGRMVYIHYDFFARSLSAQISSCTAVE